MSDQCPLCSNKLTTDFTSGEVVCRACGAVAFTIEENSPNMTASHIFTHANPKSLEVSHVIDGVKGRLSLNDAIAREAKHIAEGIIREGTHSSVLEVSYFSLYIACRPHNPMLCEKILEEFQTMGLKADRKNSMKVLTKFWRFYRYRRTDIESYLRSLIEDVKSSPYIENYVRMLVGANANILWAKVRELSAALLKNHEFGGSSLKVRALACLNVACEKTFNSFGLENPVSLDLLSYNFRVNRNNLKKMSENVTVTSYEDVAEM